MLQVSIKTSLAAMLMGLLACIVGIGTLSIYKLGETNENVVQLGTNWLPSVDVTHRIAELVAVARIQEGSHILSTAESEMQSLEKEMADAAAGLKSSLAAYDILVSSDEERANYTALVDAIEGYGALHQKLLDLSRVNRNDEAAVLFKGEMKRAFERVVSFSNKAVEINKSGGDGETTRAAEGFAQTKLIVGIAIALSILFALGATAFVVKRVSQPIAALARAMAELAEGHFDVVLPGLGRKDEIGDIAAAVEGFKIKAVEKATQEAELQETQRRAGEAARKTEMRRLADEFQKAVGGIVDAVSAASSQLEGAATSLTGTASSTQELSNAVAAASEQTSANVQGVAAASEQLSSTVTEISRQVQESTSIASAAVEQAAKTNDRVTELSRSADRIGDVIGLINTIAGQTNLLALNATIEAARAGDAGKGFAVVAQEVKALASQTAKATSEITTQIASMQSATSEAVGAIREITATINRISEISVAIAAAVEEQGATTNEISRNVVEAAKGTAEVASNITEVSRGAGETGSASSQVLSSAKALSGESQQLKSEVEKFLRTVRAA